MKTVLQKILVLSALLMFAGTAIYNERISYALEE